MPIYEIGSALFCSTLISPVMTIMDTAIIRSQFENMNIYKAYKETIKNYVSGNVSGNVKCYRPLRIMNGVYFSTYASANLTELYCKNNNLDNKLPTFCITSLVNITAITYKDKEFIKMFENKVFKFPYTSYGLFALRDSLTIASTFVVKKDLVRVLHHDYNISYNIADFISSFTIPIIAQIFSTPIHILALDIYQKPNDSIQNRIKNIYKLYPSVCSGRMIRIVPAFCFGSYLNDILRSGRYFLD